MEYVYTGPNILNMLPQQIDLLCTYMRLWLLLCKLSFYMVIADVYCSHDNTVIKKI